MDDQLFCIVDAVVHVTVRRRELAISSPNPGHAQPVHGGEVRQDRSGGRQGTSRVVNCDHAGGQCRACHISILFYVHMHSEGYAFAYVVVSD